MPFPEIEVIADPAERVRAVNEALATTKAELFAIRREAVREMRRTQSYGEVAGALGVSRTRVQQLEK